MKLILHIGMGKTGSSAIQRALATNATQLRSQKFEYLGMWFDMLDKRYRGGANQRKFLDLPRDEMRRGAEALLGDMRGRAKARGAETFIMSNETFAGYAHGLAPLVERLREEIKVHAIGYARHPAAWLPSAYAQWGIRHKAHDGPVPTYKDRAGELVRKYTGLLAWGEAMGDILDMRPYDGVDDIVADFTAAIGLKLDVPAKRVLERSEAAETLLRARFNERITERVRPSVFDEAVFKGASAIPTLQDSIQRYFDYSATDTIIDENHALFEKFHKLFGFDLLAQPKAPPTMPEPEALRHRLLECLVEIAMGQALRIQQLEPRLAAIEARGSGNGQS